MILHSFRYVKFGILYNNLDLETKEHVVQVLKAYPGALIVISHDEGFLNSIGIVDVHPI
jgi:hypothetical protein